MLGTRAGVPCWSQQDGPPEPALEGGGDGVDSGPAAGKPVTKNRWGEAPTRRTVSSSGGTFTGTRQASGERGNASFLLCAAWTHGPLPGLVSLDTQAARPAPSGQDVRTTPGSRRGGRSRLTRGGSRSSGRGFLHEATRGAPAAHGTPSCQPRPGTRHDDGAAPRPHVSPRGDHAQRSVEGLAALMTVSELKSDQRTHHREQTVAQRKAAPLVIRAAETRT